MKLKRKLTPLFFGLVLVASLLVAIFTPPLQGTAAADYGDDAAGCQFNYSTGSDEINRSNCSSSQLGSITYKDSDEPFTKFTQKSDDKDCVQTITIQNPGDTTGELSGQYEKDNTRCVSFRAHTITIGAPIDDGGTSCSGSSAISWIMCPLIDGLQSMVGAIYDNLIKPLLVTKPLSTLDVPSNQTYQAWKNFRIYGDVFLVIGLLVIVFGESIGGGLIDAYTAKKVLPRLLIAAVLINLSFYIVSVLVDIMNIVGSGVMNLITAPFGLAGDFSIELGKVGATSFLTLLVAAGTFLYVSFSGQAASFIIFVILLPLALVMLAILATVLIRWALIIFLVVISPVAFALYCLPNTEKYFRQWWDTLFKTLLVYPIIAALFAMGKVSANLLSTAGGASWTSDPVNAGDALVGGVGDLLAIIAFMVPLFLIPFSFKIAGGVLGSAFGALDGWRSRGHKFTEGTRQRIATQAGKNRIQARQKLYSDFQARASAGNGKNFVPRFVYKGANKIIGGYNIEAAAAAARADTMKTLNDQIATGKDEEIRGLSVNKRTAESRVNASSGRRQYKSLGGAWIDEADVDAGYARWGKDTYAQQAALSYEMRKAATEEEVAGIAQGYKALATGPGGWGQNDQQAGGTWIGAAFEHQNDHLEYKHTDWKSGTMDAEKARKFVNEVYEKKGSYPMSQNGSNTVKALQDIYAAGYADEDMRSKIAGIAETFTYDRGLGGSATAPGGSGTGDDYVPPVPATPGTVAVGGGRQTNAQGPAHFNERVNELARMTGVIHNEPAGQYIDPRENPQGGGRPAAPGRPAIPDTPTNPRYPGPEAGGGQGRSQKS